MAHMQQEATGWGRGGWLATHNARDRKQEPVGQLDLAPDALEAHVHGQLVNVVPEEAVALGERVRVAVGHDVKLAQGRAALVPVSGNTHGEATVSGYDMQRLAGCGAGYTYNALAARMSPCA